MLDSSKLKKFVDNNFKFDENGGNSQKGWKTSWEMEKKPCYEQFLLSPQCFQKTCTADTSKPGIVWESVTDKRFGQD